MLKYLLATLVAFFCFASIATANSYTLESDIEYSTTPSLTLDVYEPTSRVTTPTPVVILVHGGAWRGGQKEDVALQAITLAAQGFVAVAINYNQEATYPFWDQLNNVMDAIDWVRNSSSTYQTDDDAIALFGFSAGAHLSAMISTTHWGVADRVEAFVSWSGPMDLIDMATNDTPRDGCVDTACDLPDWIVTTMPTLLGCPVNDYMPWMGEGERPASCFDYYFANSPVNYVRDDAAPTLLVHTEQDGLIYYKQAERMKRELDNRNIDNQLLMLEGDGHANQLYGDAMQPTLNFLASKLLP